LPRAAPSDIAGSQAGFTVIEVLVALVLVATSLAAIGSLMATTMRGVRSLEQHVALIESARAVTAGLPLHGQLVPGALSGETSGHRWRVDVSPWTGGGVAVLADSPWIPQLIAIQVQSPSGAILNLRTVRLQKRPAG